MTYLSLTGKDSLQRMDITEALPSPYTPIALKVQAPMVSRYCEALDLCKNPLAQRFFPSLRRLFQTTTEMARVRTILLSRRTFSVHCRLRSSLFPGRNILLKPIRG